MKKLIFAGMLFGCSCTQQTPPVISTNPAPPEKEKTYVPGLGEFMGGIQMHHAKLWFAGSAANWKLSQFEVDELKELFENIKTYVKDREEVKSLDMIYAPIDSLDAAIKQKDLNGFKRNFNFLTKTCNSCHTTVNFEFNVITIPKTPPVSNQDFEPRK